MAEDIITMLDEETLLNPPKVTVLMPVYDSEKYLGEAIESILNQTFKDFELLIICDNPSDNIKSTLDHYLQLDGRIVVHYQERMGLIASLNKGCRLARGLYIARMDADDISLPKRLETQVMFLDSHPEVGVLGSRAQMCVNGHLQPLYPLPIPGENGLIKWQLIFSCPMVHPTVMMRRDLLDQVGGYNSNMKHAEDYDLWRRLSFVTQFSNLQNVFLYLRKHELSVSHIHQLEQRDTSIKISQLMISEVLGEDIPLDDVKRLWNNGQMSLSDVLNAANFIYRVCHVFIRETRLSAAEIKLVRRDAAIRLLRLLHTFRLTSETIVILKYAFELDPSFPYNFAYRLLVKYNWTIIRQREI
jgi:glycosyltransferase involved in cell wall biosynthesis